MLGWLVALLMLMSACAPAPAQPAPTGTTVPTFLPGTWRVISHTAEPSPRINYAITWSGTKLLVWGGRAQADPSTLGDGAAYAPMLDQWEPLPTAGAPSARSSPRSVWTGREWIIWGGQTLAPGQRTRELSDAVAYDPTTQAWRTLRTDVVPAELAGSLGTPFWTGSEVLLWNTAQTSVSGLWNPESGAWRPLTLPAHLSSRPDTRFCRARWTGAELLVWCGGVDPNRPTADDRAPGGARYDPTTDTWRPMSAANAPSQRFNPYLVWTGQELLVWGGNLRGPEPRIPSLSGQPTYPRAADGGRYDSTLDTWRSFSGPELPTNWSGAAVEWTGSHIVLYGGHEPDPAGGYQVRGTGYWWDLAAGRMRIAQDPPVELGIRGRAGAFIAWTGSSLVIWGGDAGLLGGALSDGAVFTPR